MKENKWVRLLAYNTCFVNQELLLQNEYLAAENRILRAHLPCLWRIPKSSGDWSFIQASTVRPPAVRIQAYR